MRHVASSRSQAGFNLIEIAIALAVIGFALVAIMGVLPAGLTVQQENREETIINQDGPYLLELIRNGAIQPDELEAHWEQLQLVDYNVGTGIATTNPGVTATLEEIVGQLSRPAGAGNVNYSHTVSIVRAITGVASDRSPDSADLGFKYKLSVEVLPFDIQQLPPDSVNHAAYSEEEAKAPRRARENESKFLTKNLYEVRLTFRWPLRPNGSTGGKRAEFRTFIAAAPEKGTGEFYYFKPQGFVSGQ